MDSPLLFKCGVWQAPDKLPAAQAEGVRQLTSSGAMVAETIGGDKLGLAEAVAIGPMVPI